MIYTCVCINEVIVPLGVHKQYFVRHYERIRQGNTVFLRLHMLFFLFNAGMTPLKSALFHRSDSSSAADFRDGPPPKFNRERNVASVARNYPPDDQAYDGIKNPYVLIINNVNFYNDPRPRNGARHDLDNLKRFMKEAGFRSAEKRIHHDLRKTEMLNILEGTRQNGALGEWPWMI